MKNYLIISAAALLLLAACAKVTPVETPDKAVAFQVTNTVATTKADILPGVDGFDTFHTYAIYHPDDLEGSQQWFMENVAVQALSSNSYEWAPARPYYWPKAGSVSFFCYAGTREPLVYPTPEDMTRMGFGGGENDTYMGIMGIPQQNAEGALSAVDNILVADPAYEYTESAYVPILFRHMLAKIRFQLVLNDEGSDGRTIWHLVVHPAVNEDKQPIPMLSVPNYGKLVVSYPSSSVADPVLADNCVQWTLLQREGGDFEQPIYAQAMDLRSDKTKEDGLIEVPVDQEGQALCARECVVIPQPFGGLVFHLEFDLSSEYEGNAGLTEHFVLDVPMSEFYPKTQTDLTWKPNHIYTYRITVSTTSQITFDPAVENWVEESSGLNI